MKSKYRAWDKIRKKMMYNFVLAPTSPTWGAFNYCGEEKFDVSIQPKVLKKIPKDLRLLVGYGDYGVFDWADFTGLHDYEVMMCTMHKDLKGNEVWEGDRFQWESAHRLITHLKGYKKFTSIVYFDGLEFYVKERGNKVSLSYFVLEDGTLCGKVIGHRYSHKH